MRSRRFAINPRIYKLFGDRFAGKPYVRDDAEAFLNWAREGWSRKTHFVFIVTTESGSVAAALDIKSNNLAAAEIGYWCGHAFRGLTGSAVNAMLKWGFAHGFEEFYAIPINIRSMLLLARQGFVVELESKTPENIVGLLSAKRAIQKN